MKPRIPRDALLAPPLRQKADWSETGTCHYCGSVPPVGGHTRDHVPPQWLYPPSSPGPRPSNWLTAPLCLNCKTKTDDDDKVLFHSVATAAFRQDASLWTKFVTDVVRSPHPAARLDTRRYLQQLSTVAVRSEAGLHLGKCLGVAFDEDAVKRAIGKAVRALHWVVHGSSMPADAVLTVFSHPPAPLLPMPGGHVRFSVGPRFHAIFHRVVDRPDVALWRVLFYRCWAFSVFVEPPSLAAVFPHSGRMRLRLPGRVG